MLARALALALLWVAAAAAQVPVPALSARVTDLTNTLSAGQRSALEAKLAAFERAKGSQVAVLIVATTQPEEIEQFGIRVADAWKIGRGGAIDDGVILLVAKEDRRVRIEVGYGLEGALPDVVAKRIIEEEIVPRFRAGDFSGGIDAGVDRILRVIEGEPLPPPSRTPPGQLPPVWVFIVPVAIGFLVRALHNRFTGATTAGGLAALLGWWTFGFSQIAMMSAVIAFFVVGTFGRQLSGGRGGGWASGGWSGGGSGGGFGGGGFSGGGGGFGGGGASGRW